MSQKINFPSNVFNIYIQKKKHVKKSFNNPLRKHFSSFFLLRYFNTIHNIYYIPIGTSTELFFSLHVYLQNKCCANNNNIYIHTYITVVLHTIWCSVQLPKPNLIIFNVCFMVCFSIIYLFLSIGTSFPYLYTYQGILY